MFKHIKRFLWLLLAIISFIFGVIGILLPVVPQVPLVYGFNSDHVEMLEQIMSPEFMGQLGYAGSGSGGGGGSPGVSSMTEDEINAILNEITDSRRKTVCS